MTDLPAHDAYERSAPDDRSLERRLAEEIVDGRETVRGALDHPEIHLYFLAFELAMIARLEREANRSSAEDRRVP